MGHIFKSGRVARQGNKGCTPPPGDFTRRMERLAGKYKRRAIPYSARDYGRIHRGTSPMSTLLVYLSTTLSGDGNKHLAFQLVPPFVTPPT